MGDAPESDQTVHIFYSSTAQPAILDAYEEAVTYLRESNVDVNVVDITESPEPARQFDVVSTPAVVVESGDDVTRYTGVMTGLADLLKQDTYGQSVLYETGFKAGRDQAAEHGLTGETDEDAVADALTALLGREDVAVSLDAFDPDTATADVTVQPQGDASPGTEQIVHEQLSAFLGGLFTAVFGESVRAEEQRCVKEGDETCFFAVRRDDQPAGA